MHIQNYAFKKFFLTSLAAISKIIFLAAATPLGSPSMRMTSGGRASPAPALASEGMIMDVHVSVLILFTGGEHKEGARDGSEGEDGNEDRKN